MYEIDLNNGRFREVDLSQPCYCAKCNKEIVRDKKYPTINLIVNVHQSGVVFCRSCMKKLTDFAGKKINDYEAKLVQEFLDEEV